MNTPTTFTIENVTPCDITAEITQMFSRDGENSFKAKRACIKYNIRTICDRNDFPLVIEGTLDSGTPAILKIRGVACGFIGMASYATLSILRGFGFDVEPNEIMTCNKANTDGFIHLIYEQ